MTKENNGFPQGWIEQLGPLLGDALPDFLRSYEWEPLRGVRMRPGIGRPAWAEDPVPWAENAYYLPLDSQAGAMPLHEAGAYYLQEPSAMAAAAALRPLPGEKVLDLCAAPGGKSTQLAAYLEGRGVLVCNEPVPARAQILSRNLERMGVANGAAVCAVPEELSPKWPAFFDKVLVDAPCSGEGMFRRHPESRREWTPASPRGCAQRQREILDHGGAMLRPGGLLAYSTCTFNAEENEGTVESFLKKHPEFSLQPFQLPGLPPCGGMLRLWPHLVRGEGHFVALLRKEDRGMGEPRRERRQPPEASFPSPGKAEAALAEGFLREHVGLSVTPNGVFAGKIVALPEGMPPFQGVRVLRAGLQIGEVKGRVLIPDHALALACPSLRSAAVTEAEARAYQAGQVLPAPEGCRGFYTLTLEGMNLGWGKASDGQMKNHYPKGLRR